MRSIKFITNGHTIPIFLELEVDGETRVFYERTCSGFIFVVWEADSGKALEIVHEIAQKIKEEHGVFWRTISIGITETADSYCVIEWKCRVRDSY